MSTETPPTDAQSSLQGLLGADFRDLAELDGATVAYNIAYLAGVWATIAGAVAVVRWKRSPLTLALAFLTISGRHQALLNVQHEAIHQKFVPGGRPVNDRVAIALCASPCASPYWASRARHLAHHRLLSKPSDPDGELHKGADKDTRAGLVAHFVRGVSGAYAARILRRRGVATEGFVVDPEKARRDPRNIAAAQAVIAVGFTRALGWWAYPALWLAPLGTVTSFLHQLRSYAEHAVLPDELPDHTNRYITTTSNPVERFLVAPYWMNMHSEHHIAPWVPARKSHELRRRLEASESAPTRITRSSYVRTVLDHVKKLP